MTFYDDGAPARLAKMIRATADPDKWAALADNEAVNWTADRYGWPLDAGQRAEALELADAIRDDMGITS